MLWPPRKELKRCIAVMHGAEDRFMIIVVANNFRLHPAPRFHEKGAEGIHALALSRRYHKQRQCARQHEVPLSPKLIKGAEDRHGHTVHHYHALECVPLPFPASFSDNRITDEEEQG